MSGDLKERIEQMLAGLGDTADAVADSLRSKGIKGTRDDGCNCPIARVIQEEFPESADIAWADSVGSWFVTGGYVSTPEGQLDPPGPVTEFIELFDNGRGNIWSESHEYPFADLDEDAEDEDEEDAGAER